MRRLSLFVTATLLACGDGGTGPGAPITELPRTLSSDERLLIEHSTSFGFDLLGPLSADDPEANLFFSPLSASMALGMTLNGAAATTFDGMADALGLGGLDESAINQGYEDLIGLLTGLDPVVDVRIANSVWARLGYPILGDFLDRVAEHFDATAEAVDFGAPGTLARINGWVSDGTGGKIPRMYDRLPPDLVVLLLNAVYFKADWTETFDRDDTRIEPFATPGGPVDVPLMRRTGAMSVYGDAGLSAVELPYGGGAFSFVALLPREGTSAGALASALDPDRWRGIAEGLVETEGTVVLPRFELEWEKELNDVLIALGMEEAFDPARADFSRMVQNGGVYIDEVKQKSFIAVDEKGTEAAAATGVAIVETSAPPEIRFDRPFVFAIRERLSGTLLFLGVLNDPS